MKSKKEGGDWMSLVGELKELADKKGITQEDIAKRTGYLQPNVSRFFSLRYIPRLDVFLNIAKAIGVKTKLNRE